MFFRVDMVLPGHTRSFAPNRDMRIFSLAAGKLRVRIEGQPEFVIGPNGMFSIKPRLACTVENRLYIDAVLHVSTIGSR